MIKKIADIKTRSLIIVVIILSFYTPGLAFISLFTQPATDSIQIWKLSVMIGQLGKQITYMYRLLNETKAHGKTLIKLKDLAVDTKKEYDFVKNFDLERELENITEDFKRLTYLDELIENKNLTDEQKFRYITKEIDKRFTDEEPSKKKVTARLKAIEKMSALQKVKADDVKSSAGNISLKKASMYTANSTALLASLKLAEEQRRLQKEIAVEMDNKKKAKQVDEYGSFIEQMSK